MNAGIIGLDCLRFILLRGFSLRLLVPLVMPLTMSLLVSLLSVMSVVGLSGSDSLWKPLWPFASPFDARCVVMVCNAPAAVLGLGANPHKGVRRASREQY